MSLDVGDALDSLVECIEDIVDRDTALAIFDVLARRSVAPRLERWLAAEGHIYPSGWWLHTRSPSVNAAAPGSPPPKPSRELLDEEPTFVGTVPMVGGGDETWQTLWRFSR